MTAKELFLEMLKPDGNPDRLLVQYEALNLWLFDPVNGYLMNGRHPGMTGKDRWGVTISWPEDHPGQQPIVNDETRVLKDITHWRDYVKAPEIATNCQEGWEECRTKAREATGENRLLSAFSGTGLFEECHFLMGFADTLTNLYEHPQEMHELIDYICEYKLGILKLYCEKLRPDAVFFHDDWGTKTQLFMSPEMWREFFKEPYRRIYGYIRSQGVIAIHHADSYLSPIVEDMAEIGIQCWQGVLPENNIPELQERLAGKMILMGGIGAAIDTPDSREEEIRAYVRRALEEYAPGGHFIPCITYGLAGTIFPHVDPIINEEIQKFNTEGNKREQTVSLSRPVAKEAADVKAEKEEAAGDILGEIRETVEKGRKKKIADLTKQALSRGKTAAEILEQGLIAGMTKLGEEFSAGDVFVPEMLMAAKCMYEAMEVLKPLLKGGEQKAAGRVVIGTVRGDLHDIGKNIVKIMLEGSGLEVTDLGVDVSAEEFVQTAKDKNCDLIALSSLLTTSMNEMQRVVELAKEEGIREQVRILIGGAPTSQEFCDRIGADHYTPDAASCARLAVSLVADNR